MSVRGRVKRAVETAFVLGGGASIARRAHGSRLLVLAYHNIVPNGLEIHGDRSLHLRQSDFATQLDTLTRTHEVVSLTDALSHVKTGTTSGARPLVAITFDDAYSGALTAGVAELRTRQLPATIFVTPSFLDGKQFWWDTLSHAREGLDEAFRARALTEAHGLNKEILELAHADGMKAHEVPPHTCGASTEQMATALEFSGITFAAHTVNHPNLVSLDDAELMNELVQPFEWLKQYGDRALPMVSYPYGLADRRVMDASRNAGYDAGFMIEGGWASVRPEDPFSIPRLNVPAGVSRAGFVLRAAGVIKG